MIFKRKKYLDELIAGRGNGLVKIITGVRRCGKSFLLFDIWHNWLLEHGVTDSHIIEIQLDDFRNRRLRKPDALLDYIDSKVVDDGNPYYIVLDEVQLVEEFVEVILSLTHMRNVDVYVSGSNSRFLSSDVVTEFRGRGDEIRIWPLTFDEYFNGIGGDIRKYLNRVKRIDANFNSITEIDLLHMLYCKCSKSKHHLDKTTEFPPLPIHTRQHY